MEGNVGNFEFDEDGTVMSNGGSDGVGCEHIGGCSAVEFFFSSFDGALAFFMSSPRPPPSKEDFFLNMAAQRGVVSGTCYAPDIASHFLVCYKLLRGEGVVQFTHEKNYELKFDEKMKK